MFDEPPHVRAPCVLDSASCTPGAHPLAATPRATGPASLPRLDTFRRSTVQKRAHMTASRGITGRDGSWLEDAVVSRREFCCLNTTCCVPVFAPRPSASAAGENGRHVLGFWNRRSVKTVKPEWRVAVRDAGRKMLFSAMHSSRTVRHRVYPKLISQNQLNV